MPIFYTENGFLKAVANGDLALIDKFFAHGGKEKWLAVRGEVNKTALHFAAAAGQAAVIKKLLEAGADIEAKDAHNATPLGAAVMARKLDAMKTLIEAGADTKATTQHGSLLTTSITYYFEDGFKYLLEKNPGADFDEPLREAVWRGYNGMIAEMLKAGATPEKTELGMELLLHAIDRDSLALVKELAERGVDINAQNNGGGTALHHAAYRNRPDIAIYLLERGADYSLKNNDGKTARELATDHGHHAIANRLKAMEEEHLAKTATPLNAGVNRMPGDSAETWVLMGEKQVAHVGVYPAVGRRLTHIFNFESRERIIISENLKTGAESVTQPEKFDALEQPHLQKALSAFRELGGKADEAAVFGGSMAKKSLPGPGV